MVYESEKVHQSNPIWGPEAYKVLSWLWAIKSQAPNILKAPNSNSY